jgi:hypothetical protein
MEVKGIAKHLVSKRSVWELTPPHTHTHIRYSHMHCWPH